MKIIRALSVFSLICFLWAGASAQETPAGGTISGLVMTNDYATPNATVVLKSKQGVERTATTDAAGKYVFANVAPGEYEITAQMGAATSRIITVGENQSLTVDLDLRLDQRRSPANFVREFVTISADSNQTIEQVSKTVNVIDAQQMRDRADFSLVESLRSIPGFRVQQLGGFGRLATIKTRGLRNQDTAVLIDGVRFRDASAITGDASSFLSDFTLTNVSRVEVLRGSGSSLYGTNAIGGTIDFQTPRPAPGLHGQIGGVFGGYGLGRFRGNISDGTDDGKFAYGIGISRTAYTKGIDGEDNAHNTNFQSRIEYNPFDRTNLSGRFFVSDAYVRLNSSPNFIGTALPPSVATIIDAVPLSRDELRRYENGTALANLNRGSANFIPDANDPDNFQKSKFFNGQLVLTHAFNDKLSFQGYYSGLKTSRKNDNGTRGLGFQSASTGFFDGTIQTANGRFSWTPNSANQITAGYEFEHEKYGNDGFTPDGTGNFFARAGQSSHTVYAQDLISLFDKRLQLAGGFRAQFFDLKNPSFSVTNTLYSGFTLENPPNSYTFDGAASYFFYSTGTKLRAHVGNGYRVPSLYERFGSTYFFGFTALGDPELKPERSIAYDAGIEQNLLDNRVRLTAVYFYTKLIDTIGFGTGRVIQNTPRPFGGYLNTKGGIARGAEASGEVRVTDSTDVFASYTFTNSDQRVSQVPTVGIIDTLGVPRHQFTFVATQRFKRAWVNADFLAESGYLAPLGFPTRVFRFEGNRKMDLTGGYTFPLNNEKMNLRVYATIENVLNNDYYENGFRTFGRHGRIGASFGF